MLENIKNSWSQLNFVPQKIVHDINESKKSVLLNLKKLSSQVIEQKEAPKIAKEIAVELSTSLDLLLEGSQSLDPEYIKVIANILDLFPKLLAQTTEPELLQQANTQKAEISLFNELYSNKVNPVGVMTASQKTLGSYLIELGFVTREQIDVAIVEQRAGNYPGLRIGHILEKMSLITRAQLNQAIEHQMIDNMSDV